MHETVPLNNLKNTSILSTAMLSFRALQPFHESLATQDSPIKALGWIHCAGVRFGPIPSGDIGLEYLEQCSSSFLWFSYITILDI